MTNLYYAKSYTDAYNLSEIGFISGSSRDIEFTIYNESGTTLQYVWGCFANWKLYYFEEELDNPIVEKTVYMQDDNSFLIPLLASDTQGLSGKFAQEISITDFSGKRHQGGTGILYILPSALQL